MAVGGGALFEVTLVIFLGGPEGTSSSNFGGDGAMKLAAGIQCLLGLFRGRFLLGGMEENGGAVLLAEVRTLVIYLGRVVHFPESVEQLLIADFRRIEGDLHNFGVASGVSANVAVTRILCVAAGVAGNGVDDAGYAAKIGFDAPETASTERSDFRHAILPSLWRYLGLYTRLDAQGTRSGAPCENRYLLELYEAFLCVAGLAPAISASFCLAGALYGLSTEAASVKALVASAFFFKLR